MIERIRTPARYAASLEIWPVAFLVAASVVSARVLPWALGVACSFWIIRWMAYGHASIRTPADWPITVLVLMLPITLWITAWPETTRLHVYRLLSGMALYYAIVNWTTSAGRLRLLANVGIPLAGLFLALMAPFSVVWSGSELPFIPAWVYAYFSVRVSDTVNANQMAGSLAIVLPCILGLLLVGWQHLHWPNRILSGIAALAMSGVLLLTQSRGGLLALAAALLAIAVLRWRRAWALLLGGAITGLFVGQLLGVHALLDTLTTGSTFQGFGDRYEVWSRGIYIIQDFPLTGAGMGSFEKIVDLMYPLFFGSTGISHAHNLFLQVAVDLGIPGLLAWVAIMLLAATTAWQTYRYGRSLGNGWVAGLGAGVLASQVAVAVHGLLDVATWGVRAAAGVWALWGLAIAAWNICGPVGKTK